MTPACYKPLISTSPPFLNKTGPSTFGDDSIVRQTSCKMALCPKRLMIEVCHPPLRVTPQPHFRILGPHGVGACGTPFWARRKFPGSSPWHVSPRVHWSANPGVGEGRSGWEVYLPLLSLLSHLPSYSTQACQHPQPGDAEKRTG